MFTKMKRRAALTTAICGLLVLGTAMPASAGVSPINWAGPYKTYSACKYMERAYNSSWTKIVEQCKYTRFPKPEYNGYYFAYRTVTG